MPIIHPGIVHSKMPLLPSLSIAKKATIAPAVFIASIGKLNKTHNFSSFYFSKCLKYPAYANDYF